MEKNSKNVKDHTQRQNPSKSSDRRQQLRKVIEAKPLLDILPEWEDIQRKECTNPISISSVQKIENRSMDDITDGTLSPDQNKEEEALSAECSSEKELDRKESPINPYNPNEHSPVEWSPPDIQHQDPRISLGEQNSILKTYFHSPIYSTGEFQGRVDGYTSGIRKEGNCREDVTWKEKYREIREKVEKAVKKHKIFLIRGELPKLKEALEKRGWVQKYESSKTRSLPYGSVSSLEAKSLGDIRQTDGILNERALIFAMLRHRSPDFIWDCRNDFIEWDSNLKSTTILNRFQKPATYTSKLGMANVLQDSHWLYEQNVADINFPRSYNLSKELDAFIRDFRQTAAMGLLKWFVQKVQEMDTEKDWNELPINIDRVKFALERCNDYITNMKHENIDELDTEVPEDEWDKFCEDFNRMMHDNNGILGDTIGQSEFQKIYEAAVTALEELKQIDPQYKLNGMRNIWILKPSLLCCGAGISISHNLEEILRKAETRPKNYFVVQKYIGEIYRMINKSREEIRSFFNENIINSTPIIEHPLLIQNTKFDIRLWYLVTCTFPLTIWQFREALLRFSSKPYTFATYHEAIHICNTAVQERYDSEKRRRLRRGEAIGIEESVRDQGWDCEKLNKCLKNMGYEGEPYYDTIYPRMSQAIVMTMLAAQESMDERCCSFELYGADFMVMDDLSVWLIEINTNPRMHPPSSKISQRLYESVLDGLVRVIMDLPLNPNADTGSFVLTYKQSVPEFQPYLGPCFFAIGKSMTLQEPQRKRQERKANICSPWSKQNRARTAPPTVARLRDPKIVDFIDYLNSTNCAASNWIYTSIPSRRDE